MHVIMLFGLISLSVLVLVYEAASFNLHFSKLRLDSSHVQGFDKRIVSKNFRRVMMMADEKQTADLKLEVKTDFWDWNGYRIRFQSAGLDKNGPPMLLVHGFGGNCDHWRKNLPELAEKSPTYAIDLLGYGYSEKPSPRDSAPNTIYNFENWGQQLVDFITDVIGKPTFVVCNSVGGVAGLQASLYRPDIVSGIVLLDISLRMLHTRKQFPLQRPFTSAFQTLLRETPAGKSFFAQVATPQGVRAALEQAYSDKSQVTDELVDAILKPGLEPGAVEVFLDFISYSGGPLPEDLLPLIQCPVLIAWGENDPWEPILMGKEFAKFDCVEDFVTLPGVGHCPQDEAPQLVNPLLQQFVERHT